MDTEQSLHRLVFGIVLWLLLPPVFSEAIKYCWDNGIDSEPCCRCSTTSNSTLLCRDECPPNYYVSRTGARCGLDRAFGGEVKLSRSHVLRFRTTCFACHQSCSGCTGAGASNCVNKVEVMEIFYGEETKRGAETSHGKGASNGQDTSNGQETTTNGENTTAWGLPSDRDDKRHSDHTGLVTGVSVTVLIVFVLMLTLIVTILRFRRLHKRDHVELAGLDARTVNTGNEELACGSKKAVPEQRNYENIPMMPSNEAIQRGHEKVSRYTQDPTAKSNRRKNSQKRRSRRSANESNIYEEIDGEVESRDSGIGNSIISTTSCVAVPDASAGDSIYQNHEIDSVYENHSIYMNTELQPLSSVPEELYENTACGKLACEQPEFSAFWQFTDRFSAAGGVLRGSKSDVSLRIPKNGVGGGSWTCMGMAVCTDLGLVHSALRLPEDEHIASPVVEYSADLPHFKSQRPMTINLPHFLPSVSLQAIKVYCFRLRQSPVTQSTAPRERLHVEQLVFVEKGDMKQAVAQGILETSPGIFCFDSKMVYIRTTHFSGYFCTNCSKDFTPPELPTEVHAKLDWRRKKVDLRLDVWDSRYNIADFRENRPEKDSSNFAGMQLIDSKVLHALSKDANLDQILLGARLELTEESAQNWTHKKKKNGDPVYPPEWSIELKECAPCNCRPRVPLRLDWQLVVSVPPGVTVDLFECLVEVGYVQRDAGSDVTQPLRFVTNPAHVTIDVSRDIPNASSDNVQVQEISGARITNMSPSLARRENVRNVMTSNSRPPARHNTSFPVSSAATKGTAYTTSFTASPTAVQPSTCSIESVKNLIIHAGTETQNPHLPLSQQQLLQLQLQQQQQFHGRPAANGYQMGDWPWNRQGREYEEPVYSNMNYSAPIPDSSDLARQNRGQK